MIETVRQRQQNANDFKACYDNLCALQSSCPLGAVTGNLGEDTLDCNADRVMLQDWKPILDATRINKNLKVIAFRSYWQEKLCATQTGTITKFIKYIFTGFFLSSLFPGLRNR